MLLFDFAVEEKKEYPRLRYMGSKFRLIPWVKKTLSELTFESALDAFSGSGVVGYTLKQMGKQVYSNDFLNFSYHIAQATVENSSHSIQPEELDFLLSPSKSGNDFIQKTFKDIFYSDSDLVFLDSVRSNIDQLDHPHKKSIALSALFRSCVKKQPRGVFTVSGDLSKYDDGRRDLRLSIQEHFIEQIKCYNSVVFDNGKKNKAYRGDIFDFPNLVPDLVYMDPPYVPKSDDNCYIKRYHFIEGLSNYWKEDEIMYQTKVKKIKKRYTPFSYRRTAIEAFDKMFNKFRDSILVLSYSSNGFPDLETLVDLMGNYKKEVVVHKKNHTYHFGTHSKVNRSKVQEYLIIGT